MNDKIIDDINRALLALSMNLKSIDDRLSRLEAKQNDVLINQNNLSLDQGFINEAVQDIQLNLNNIQMQLEEIKDKKPVIYIPN